MDHLRRFEVKTIALQSTDFLHTILLYLLASFNNQTEYDRFCRSS